MNGLDVGGMSPGPYTVWIDPCTMVGISMQGMIGMQQMLNIMMSIHQSVMVLHSASVPLRDWAGQTVQHNLPNTDLYQPQLGPL